MTRALIHRWIGFLLLFLVIAAVADLVLMAVSTTWRDELLLRTHEVRATVTGSTDEKPSAGCRLHHHVLLRWSDGGTRRTGFVDGCGLTTPAPGTTLTVWAGHAAEVRTGPARSLYLEELGLVVVAATGLTAWRTIRLRRRSAAAAAEPREPSGTP